MKSRELKEQRQGTIDEQIALRDAAQKENRSLTDEENTKFLELNSKVESLQRAIEVEQINEERAAKEAAANGNDFSENEKRDLSKFNICEAFRKVARGERVDGIEAEMTQEAIKENPLLTGDLSRGISIPSFMLRKEFISHLESRADQTAGTDATGGYTVPTDLLSIIPALRAPSAVEMMGATVLNGLTGDVNVPTQAAVSTAAWEGETDANAQSDTTYGVKTLTPKRVGAFSVPSKQLVLQSNEDIIAWIMSDLAATNRTTIDVAAINGSGSGGQPTGLLGTSGIGDVAMGTNGLLPTWAKIVELETKVAEANGEMGNLGYLTTPGMRGALKGVEKASGTAQFIWDGNEMNGYNANISTNVPSDLVKGSSSDCHAVIYGNWSELVLGYFGGVDLMIDPYTAATTAQYKIIINQFMDLYVRRAGSFAAIQDALTS